MSSEFKNKSLKYEISRKFLENCLKKIDTFDEDFISTLNQLETAAKQRIIEAYYRDLGKHFS